VGLDPKLIDQLLQGTNKGKGVFHEPKSKYPRPPQHGPLRLHETERACMQGKCRAPTFMSVDYVATCQWHALQILNDMVNQLTEQRRKELIA
jgi:hypothetical protein